MLTSAYRIGILEHVFGYTVRPTRAFVADYGVFQLIALSGYLLAFVLVIALAARFWPEGIASGGLRLRARNFLGGFAISSAASVVLNWAGAWPFSWREQSSGALAFAQAIDDGRHPFYSYLIWFLTTSLLTPLIEEVVFRAGLLRFVAIITRSSIAGIVLSALLFGLAHTPWWALRTTSPNDFLNAGWAMVVGLILGWFSVRRGNLSVPLGVHMGKNSTEMLSLLLGMNT